MNKPNILSNELDQVAKTGTWYQKELSNPQIQEEILDAFFYFSPDWEMFKDYFWDQNFFMRQGEKQITEWFWENKDKLPTNQMLEELKVCSIVSCEISRKKKENIGAFPLAVGPAVPVDTISLGKMLTRNKDESVKGNIITYLTLKKVVDIKKEGDERPIVEVSMNQIEFPGEGAQLPRYVVFKKELTGEEFNKENITL